MHGPSNRTANSEPAAARTNTLLPTVTLPKGGGGIRPLGDTFTTHAQTGTGSLAVPLPVTSGRDGFGPELVLRYGTAHGNGPFGVGWQLSLPAVTRRTDRGLPRYDDAAGSDAFLLDGVEELVRDPGWPHEDAHAGFRVERFRPRVETAFSRIERWTRLEDRDVHWRVHARDGVTSTFGASPTARISDPDRPSRVFSWLLERSEHPRGHVIGYVYKPEDLAGVEPASHEDHRLRGRTRTGHRYLKRIRYGNRVPGQSTTADPADWLFEVVLDYGEHAPDQPTPDEVQAWPARRDPFSQARPGFEVRTWRLCQRLLVFHRFAELSSEPVLVRSIQLGYDARALLSRLVRVEAWGHTAAGEKGALPGLTFGYSEPTLQPRVFEAAFADMPSGEGRPRRVHVVDLHGEGLPGLLEEDGGGWWYRRNRGPRRERAGAVLFGSRERVASLPSGSSLAAGHQLLDLSGDGRLDLVVPAGPGAGSCEQDDDGTWQSHVAMDALPSLDWSDRRLRVLDLDGDGGAHVRAAHEGGIVWYRSLGTAGYEGPHRASLPTDEDEGPSVLTGGETVLFADMTGDGLADVVRVRNGDVSYWPNLGFGRFGARVSMSRAPRFDDDDRFDPRRLRLADLDGSGPADIVYLHPEGAHLYANQSGNSWGDAVALTGPEAVEGFAGSRIADVRGDGTACLAWWPTPGSSPGGLRYQQLFPEKPHLLRSIRNDFGLETTITYAPSTRFMLADEEAGHPWPTRLPFPVHVVERVEANDRVRASVTVTRHAYHDGFYDAAEREFRGFALVEQWDANAFSGAGSTLGALVPARIRRWFHTGAPRAPTPTIETSAGAPLTGRERREAARALRGKLLRE